TPDIGRATRGDSMPTPRKTATAPIPTSWMAGTVSPIANRTAPATRRTDPTTERRPDDRSDSTAWSEMAAIGEIRTAGRAHGGHHGDADPDDQRGDHGAGVEDQTARRQGDPEPAEERLEAQGGQHPEPEAHHRGDQADDGRLGQPRTAHLAPAGAQHPAQGQLAGALAHDDREGVEDGERADEQRDE